MALFSSSSFLESVTFMNTCDRYHLACDSVWSKLHEAYAQSYFVIPHT